MQKSKIGLILILSLILLMFVFLPLILREVLNGPINKKIACCTLHVDDVDINYIPLQIELHGVKYFEKPQSNPEIKTTIKKGIISFKGIELDDFLIQIDLSIISPEVFYFDTGEESTQVESKQDEAGPTYLPLKILNAEVTNGKVHFSHKAVKGKQAIDFNLIDIKLSNWSFRKKDSIVSKIFISSTLEEKAKFEITGAMTPFKIAETMNIDYSLEGLDMTTVNKVLLNYIPVDVTKGMLSVYGELDRNKNKDRGYIKIFLEDFKFLEVDQEFKNTQHLIIELLSSVVNLILQNSFTENVALKIPFRKKDGEIDFDKSEAFWSSVKNLFDSLERGVENKY